MFYNDWLKAVYTMPRYSAELWQQLDIVAKWLVATRASVLFMTLMSAVIGGIFAWRSGLFDWSLWLLVCLGLVFAHALNNLINDFVDTRLGIDENNYYRTQYGVHVLQQGLMSKPQFWRYMIFTGAVALLCGGLLVAQRGGITLSLMAAGAFFVLFYTWPLKKLGLGEPAVLLVWGPLMIGGCYYVVSGQWDWTVAGFGLLYGLGPTSVLFGKHIDKMDADQQKGIYSLPVRLGDTRARQAVVAMIAMQYLGLILLVLGQQFHWVFVICFAAANTALRCMRTFGSSKPAHRPEEFSDSIWPLWFSAHAFDHTRKFTALLVLALIADTLIG